MRIQRQTDNLPRHPVGNLEIIAPGRGQSPIGREIADQRIKIPSAIDVVTPQSLINGITTLTILLLINHHRQIGVGVTDTLRLRRKTQSPDTGKTLAVDGGKRLATHDIVVDMLQLHQPERSLQLVHLGVDARTHHGHLIGEAEVLQEINPLLGLLIMTDDSPSLNGAEPLSGMKTQYGEITVTEYRCAVDRHPEGMGGIIDDPEPVGVGYLLYLVSIAGIAIYMDSHDCSCLRGDGCLDAGRVKGEPFGLNIDKDRPDVVPPERVGGGNETEGGGDNLAGDLQRLQGRHQRQGAVGKERQILHPEIFGQFLLKLLMEGSVVGEYAAVPYFFEITGELLQRREGRLGNVYRVVQSCGRAVVRFCGLAVSKSDFLDSCLFVA